MGYYLMYVLPSTPELAIRVLTLPLDVNTKPANMS